MKIRKTKKGNSIRRIVAFLLCMTMVLGLGMQDVMEQVYAEETPVTVQEGTAQDTEKITEGEQTGDEPAAPEETAPPTEETENEGSTGDTSGDGVQDEPDAGQPGEDTNTGESGGDNTGDTGTETQPGDGSTNTSGEEGNVNTPGEGDGQGTEEGDVTVPTVPEGEEGQKPAEGDATVPEGEEGQKPGEGDAAASEDTEQADVPEEEEQAEGVAFEDSYTDEKVTIQVSAEAGVIPEGAVLSVTPIEKTEPDESMSDEEKAEAEKINAQYDLTEKKLTEESDENGEVMEGFLAYDISFVVTSEDGETQSEVEPAGEVKVVMDFNEAAVPEGVSENAEVSVKHLKEDETAEDGIVVEDVTENAVVTAAETGVPAVEKVELTAESFSVYTIKWTHGDQTGWEFKVHVVGTDGKDLEGYEKNGKYTYPGTGASVEDLASGILGAEGIRKYKLEYATIGQFDNSVRITSLEVSNNDQYYKDSDGNRHHVSNPEYYFVFSEREALQPVSTEDTISQGIKINVFDYQVGTDGDESTEKDTNGLTSGINKEHKFKFVSDRKEENGEYNQGGGVQNLVESQLENGFPMLNDGETSLSYLFDENGITNAKKSVLNANCLFQKDEDGYYIYDSAENFATLDGNNFKVYNQPGTGFFPFTSTDHMFDSKKVQDNAKLGYDGINHYLGMTIESEFYQPRNGEILKSDGVSYEDMIFDFRGDDDVWVYIDGILVLDLGGIHSPVEGSINFANGVVTADGNTTSIYDQFRNAGISKEDLDNLFESYVENGTTYHRFKDYTNHIIKFFYLERGNDQSNCKIRFNIQTIPENSVLVSKEVQDENGADVNYTEDIEFQFQIEKVSGSSDLPAGLLKGIEYTILEDGTTAGTGTTSLTDGIFTLKDGQSALFKGFKADDVYIVREVGAYLGGYKIELTDTRYKLVPVDGDSTTLSGVETPEITVGNLSSTVFKNTVTNRADLAISKQLAKGANETSDTFYIQVKILDRVYTGSYSVYYADGTLIDSDKETSDNPNGYLELEAGQKVVISGLPYGATFEVVEILDENSPYIPTYSISDNGTVDMTTISIDNKASGQIIGEGTGDDDAEVTVTNDIDPTKYTIDIPVSKVWKGDPTFTENWDYVTVQLYQNGRPYGGQQKIEASNEWNYIFEDLPYCYLDPETGDFVPYEYTIEEIDIDDGYLDEDWQVEISGNAEEGFVITNIFLPHWYIQKVSGADNSVPVGGAEFTLTSTSDDTICYHGLSYEEFGGLVAWWNKKEDVGDLSKRVKYIPDDTYILEETKAPVGYQKSNITWTITITDLEYLYIVDSNGNVVSPADINTRGLVQFNVYQFENTAVFDLPSTGGPGIRMYILGGTLLLMAGALLVYRKRKKEVLGS